MTQSIDHPLESAPLAPELLAALRADVSGVVAAPGEPGYELATPWNVAVRQEPLAVVEAATPADIVATVRHAAAHGLQVAVRRTGHGAVTISGPTVLVHTGKLDDIEIDVAGRTARVGAGAIWQQVLDAATPHGLAPLVGSSPNVGVAGFLTGAGIGPFVRTFGLSSDHVRAFQVVTGEGKLLRVTPTEHPELFWGLRGGKGSLGIVTEIEIDLLDLAGFYGGALYFDGADAAAVIEAWRELTVDLPEHANTSLAILQLPPLPKIPAPIAGRMSIAVRFTTTQSPEVGERLLAPLRACAEPILDGVAPMPYAAVAAVHADPVDPMPSREVSGLLREFPGQLAEVLVDLAGPGSRSPQTVVELRLLGGKVREAPVHRSAFSHRDAAFTFLAVGVLAPEIAEAVPAHGAALEAAIEPWSTGFTLPNFTATDDPERLSRSYDDDTRHWLGALADQHDPHGVLRTGQVIRGTR
ncbi:MAG: FAD-binding oxidoreductase [Solirubrobacteraceae bacterium]|nr:FAD-binding oxidoreductase [Solirubrobacteraceae bacterium]